MQQLQDAVGDCGQDDLPHTGAYRVACMHEQRVVHARRLCLTLPRRLLARALCPLPSAVVLHSRPGVPPPPGVPMMTREDELHDAAALDTLGCVRLFERWASGGAATPLALDMLGCVGAPSL